MFEVGKTYKNTQGKDVLILAEEGLFVWGKVYREHVAYKWGQKSGVSFSGYQDNLVPPKPPVVISDAVMKVWDELDYDDEDELKDCLAAVIKAYLDEQEEKHNVLF